MPIGPRLVEERERWLRGGMQWRWLAEGQGRAWGKMVRLVQGRRWLPRLTANVLLLEALRRPRCLKYATTRTGI